MYDLHDYARMIADERRTGAYVRALEAVVRPGSVVVDVGAGTGIFALVACRLGARRVFAIDTNEAIQVGQALARENGFSDRIVFLQKDVREVELPERADVVVSDLRGVSPLCGDHLAIIEYVRDHLLKPGGVLVPASDRLMVAIADQADLYEYAIGPSTGPLGITLGAMQARLQNAARPDSSVNPIRPADLLCAPATWAVLHYATVRAGPVAGRAELTVDRPGTGHGLALWFEAVLAEGRGFATAPGEDLCYRRLFLPWPRPVQLSLGDVVAVDLWGQAAGDPWGWTSSVPTGSGSRETFKQSSFLAWPAGPTAAWANESGGMSVERAPLSHGTRT